MCEWVVWWLHEYSDPVMNGSGEGEVGRTERWEGRLALTSECLSWRADIQGGCSN